MGRKRKHVIPKRYMDKAVSAFKKKHKTHLSYIVISQVFKDKKITSYMGENASQFSERMADNFLDKLIFDNQGQKDEDFITSITAYYHLICAMLELP